jgi:hypothetical protein
VSLATRNPLIQRKETADASRLAESRH